MKQAFLFAGSFFLLLLTGCGPRIYPVAHTYQIDGYEFNSKFSKEEIWNKTIAFFISKGMSIKSLSKEDGLITTEPTSFLHSYTEEDEYGNLKNPYAFIVTNRYGFWYAPGSRYAIPVQLTGQWIVWIRENKDNTTHIRIKLANTMGRFSEGSILPIPTVRSTGIFEFSIESAFNENE